MKTTTEEYSNFIESQITTLKVLLINTSELISHLPMSNLSNSEDDLSKIFSNTKNSLTLLSSIYFVEFTDGTAYSNSGMHNVIEESHVDLRKRKWYKSAMNSDEVLISNVYNNINNNKPVITMSYKVKSGDRILGVLAADIFLEDFNKEFDLFTKSHNLNFYLIDPIGTIIAHESKGLIGHNMTNLQLKLFKNVQHVDAESLNNYIKLWMDQFSNKKSGIVSYKDFTGDEIHASFKKIETLNWTLVCKTQESLLIEETLKYSRKPFLIEFISFTTLAIISYKLFKKNYYIDKLTGVFNKNYLISTLKDRKKLLDEQHILFVNINNFSLINGKYGGHIGDLVLKELSEIITRYIGAECDTSRLESDNFLCLFKENMWEKSIQSSKLLHSKVKKLNINTNELSINVNVFMGLINIKKTQLKDPKTSIFLIESIIKELHHKSISDLIVCPSIDHIIKNKKDINEKLKFLIDVINEDKLVPFFQPIVDLDTMLIRKYEILMRIDNGNEYLSPYPYIILAEENNMISNVDLIVTEKALYYKSIVDKQDNLEFSINLSGRELENKEHINKVIELVDKHNISHKNIIFEITETQHIENIIEVSNLVKEIKNLGFKFSIDDFGTGFSSMQYLKLLPVDYIKIDGSFIKDILDKEENEHLVKSMVNMARAYKVKVVAEFVENEAILNKIKELGIDYGQGYFIGKPNKEFL
nr:GGDEF domain-containing protein [Clostridium ganghwense]